MHTDRPVFWPVLLFVALGGCAGNGEGLNAQGQPIGGPGSGSSGGSSSGGGGITADFQSIQANVFTPICSKCHIGASAPEGLQLDAAHSYNLLVGVPSVEVGSLDRIKPGDPDHSYLVLKIEGAAGIVGGQMPLGETPLPQATIDAIRQWVTDGAQDNSSQGASLARAITLEAARSFSVESSAPAAGSVIQWPVGRIVVAFSRALDASLVNDTTVSLARLGAAGEHDDGSPVALTIEVALATANQAVLLITPRSTLEPGDYRVTLRGTGAAALADLDSNVLGSNFQIPFTVEATP